MKPYRRNRGKTFRGEESLAREKEGENGGGEDGLTGCGKAGDLPYNLTEIHKTEQKAGNAQEGDGAVP